MSGFVEGRIASRQQWTQGLITLGVEAPVAPFKPGQFLNLALEVGGTLLRRAYSIASAPTAATLEFYVTEVSGGAFTPRLFELELGDSVLVEAKPQGFFTLDWLPEAEDLWLVGTGTGLGPFISMLRSGEPWRRFSRVVLVHGVRRAEELAYTDELARLEANYERRFVRIGALSRERGSGALHGRITQLLASGELEKAVGAQLSERSHLMLCGNPGMIDDVVELLASRGLRRHRTRKPGHITYERYWESDAQTPPRP